MPTQINEILAAPDRFDRISLRELADANSLSLLRLAEVVTAAGVSQGGPLPLGVPLDKHHYSMLDSPMMVATPSFPADVLSISIGGVRYRSLCANPDNTHIR